jgi:hexosaminidase
MIRFYGDDLVRKYLLCCLLPLVLVLNVQAKTSPASGIYVHFKVKTSINAASRSYTADITVTNKSGKAIKNWALAFNTPWPVTKVTHGRFVEQKSGHQVDTRLADLYILKPTGAKLLKRYTFGISGPALMKQLSDVPSGYFLIVKQGKKKTAIDIPASAVKNQFLPPKHNINFYKVYKKESQASIEGNPAKLPYLLVNTRITPLPVFEKSSPGAFSLNQKTTIVYDASMKDAKKTAEHLAAFLDHATGFSLKDNVVPLKGNALTLKNAIVLSQIKSSVFSDRKLEPFQKKSAYTLDVREHQIIIAAQSDAGLFYGVESLAQLFPAQLFSQKPVAHVRWMAKGVHVLDYPRFVYRGMMLDVVRHFRSVAEVKLVLKAMALLKMNRFQWHLTDDEGWRLQLATKGLLSQLTTMPKAGQHWLDGALRGFHFGMLPPTLGSGAAPYGGYYTAAQVADILAYAAKRHIQVIPEIDIPGHARALIKALPGMLQDPKDRSTYTSVQGYHDNVLNPCLKSTYVVINRIIERVSQMFPGNIIHIGSDELPLDAWAKSPACLAMYPHKNETEIHAAFLKRLQKIAKKYGKRLAGWNDMPYSGLDKNTLIYAWTNHQAGMEAAKQGYSVVLTPAQRLYLDLAYNASAKEPGYHWAGYVNTFTVYDYMPIPDNMPSKEAKKIVGVQGALWGETIISKKRMEYMLFPKMIALAELGWSQADRRNWNNFAARVGHFVLPRLGLLGIHYRKPPSGVSRHNGVRKRNARFP